MATLPGLALVLVLAQFGGTEPATSSEEIISAVEAEGTLTRADRDVYAASFIATNTGPEGENATFALQCNQSTCRYKLASGSSCEMTAGGNVITFTAGSMVLPTSFILQPACHENTSCRWATSAGQWFGVIPSADLSGCAAGTEGGIKPSSSDHYPYYCDGTAAQRIPLEKVGALQLPTYTTATLPAAAPAGRLVYDTDEACVKVTNGSAWSCL